MSKVLELHADNIEELCLVSKALSSPTRIQILKLLYYSSFNVKEIADALSIPPSSAALHIRILEEANLIQTKQLPGKRGAMKTCSRKNDYVKIRLAGIEPNVSPVRTISMPVGAFSDCAVQPTCGLVNEKGPIGYEDRPGDFFKPERLSAQLLWASAGYVEYKFPYSLQNGQEPSRIILTLELCSEAPNYNEEWKSDICFWLNGQECGIWHSPGDFGKRRGRLNPSWWDNGSTQYGSLVTIEISRENTLINGSVSSGIKLSDLSLTPDKPITFRLGNKENAEFIGGFNIFGTKFGDYEQDILLSYVY